MKVSPYCATVLGVSTSDANVNQVMECLAIHDKLVFGSSLKVKLVIIKLNDEEVILSCVSILGCRLNHT